MNFIRSVLFNLSFYTFSLFYCFLVMLPSAFFKGDKLARKTVHGYCIGSLFLARWVLGVKQSYRNTEILPKDGAFILASAHQSYMDPMMTYILRQDVTALAKKELYLIPVIGTMLKKCGIIRIDRASGKAHQEMGNVVRQATEMGRPIIVYPQATRIKPGDRRALKAGAYHLQKSGELPVYTVALTTGLFWSKGLFHRKGHAIFEVVRKVPSGLERDEFMKIIREDVVYRSEELYKEIGFDIKIQEETPEKSST